MRKNHRLNIRSLSGPKSLIFVSVKIKLKPLRVPLFLPLPHVHPINLK
jgi:hypothetical protein